MLRWSGIGVFVCALACAMPGAAAPSLLGVSSDQGQGAPGAVAPAYTGDLPDPFVYHDDSGFLAIGTNTGGANVPLLTSPDLGAWVWAGDAMPKLASWVKPGMTWAPTVLRRGSAWVMYYTARETASGRQAVGCAVASSPRGPFVDDAAAPLISTPQEGGAIDASPFVDDDGQAYLLWKGDSNAINEQTHIYIQPLAADGRSLTGARTSLAVRDRPWEQTLVEAPAMVKQGGRYHLFYSGGWWESTSYGVGHAVADRVTGPFRKTSVDGPVLGSHGAEQGPGGAEFFAGPGGLWAAYHAWTAPNVGYAHGGARRLHVAPVSWNGDEPVFGKAGAPVVEPAQPGAGQPAAVQPVQPGTAQPAQAGAGQPGAGQPAQPGPVARRAPGGFGREMQVLVALVVRLLEGALAAGRSL